MDKQTLDNVADWADSRVNSGQEPPWTFQSLKKLSLIARELSAGMSANLQRVSEQGEALSVEDSPRPMADIVQLDNFRSRPAEPDSLQLPT